MKPGESETKVATPENSETVTGDVIGDTAYSERYVLKILLKFANLGKLKDEIAEKTFEDDLCTLWDMTAERDVALFLHKHDVLKLFSFAMPVIESARITEIIIGIIGNMCCQKEIVDTLLKMDFMTFLLEFMKSDDSLILIQVVRLVSSGLFLASDNDVLLWMELFVTVEYSSILYFALKFNTHKDFLIAALETLNTICSYCNVEKCRQHFFDHFIKTEALSSLSASFIEVAVNQVEICDREELERIFVISLQILLTFVGFSTSPEIYKDERGEAVVIISNIVSYYENKICQREIDSGLVDVIDSTSTILDTLELHSCPHDEYFVQSYNMWKVCNDWLKSEDKESGSDFDETSKEDYQEFYNKLQPTLTLFMCNYMEKCSETDLVKVLDEIDPHYQEILSSVQDGDMKTNVIKRASYRNRLKDNVDS